MNHALVKKLGRLDKTYLQNMNEWMEAGDHSEETVIVWWESGSEQLITMNGGGDMY